MQYFLRFSTYMGILLISLFFVGYGLINYANDQPPASYQTRLVSQLSKLSRPLSWTQNAEAQYRWVSTHYKDKTWVTSDPDQTLDAWFDQTQTEPLLIMVNFESPTTLPALRALLKVKDRWQRTLLCSRADGILKDLRSLEPRWTFCSGEILMTRMLSLASLSMAGLNQIRSDVFVIHTKNIRVGENLKPVIEAAKKQNKLVFIGPVTGPTVGLNPDGWLIQPKL